jgi:hypothetical protein
MASFGQLTRVVLMKGFDERGVMNFVWSEVLKYNVLPCDVLPQTTFLTVTG